MRAFQYTNHWASCRLVMGNKPISSKSVMDSERKTRRYSPVGIRRSPTVYRDRVMDALSRSERTLLDRGRQQPQLARGRDRY